jgi:predicted porin
MKAHQKRALTAVAAVLSALGSGSAAALEVYNNKGWTLDVSGSINAFYTSTKTEDGPRMSQVENGLLPGFIKFTAATQHQGLDIKGVMGFWPGINSDAPGTESATAGVGKSHTDGRTNYLSFGNASMGTVKAGRDIGLFQSNAILNDMTLLGVGGGASLARNINTTLGGIGAGYIYAEFQPQITYTAPSLGGVTLSFGVFDSKDLGVDGAGNAAAGKTGYQGMAEMAVPGGKLWASAVMQKFTTAVDNPAPAADQQRNGTANGVELGGKVDVGALGLMAAAFRGEGIGDAVLFVNGFDAAGEKRDSDGYLVQATYKIGDLKLGANIGQSRTKGTSAEAGETNKVQGKTLGAYYNIAPSLTLVGELNKRTDKLSDADTDTVSLGAILFF